MTQPLLSILIPTTPDRKEAVNRLLKEFERQCDGIQDIGVYTGKTNEDIFTHYFHNGVSATVFTDDKTLTIGEKRELMYEMSPGRYSWQIDSDDNISSDAIALILEAIKQEPDCITFEEYVNIDGKEFKSSHSLNYSDWEGDGKQMLPTGFHFHRTPFFKSAIKTEIAKKVPVPHLRFAEDHQWAKLLKPYLKSEVHINQELYKYLHVSTPHNERYGIKELKKEMGKPNINNNLIAGRIAKQQQQNKIISKIVNRKFGKYGDISNATIEGEKLIIADGSGVTSCLSIRLDNTIAYFRINAKFPEEIDSTKQFQKYADFEGQDVSKFILGNYRRKDIFNGTNYIHDWQFNWYDEIDLSNLKPIADFVCPLSDIIISKTLQMCKMIEGRTACIYRGNDKGLEIPRAPYSAFEEMAKDSGANKFIVQTDEEDFYLWFKERFPDTIAFDEIPRINKNPDSYVMPDTGGRVEFAVNFLAALKAISTCEKVIFNTGNISIWTILFRGTTNGVYQYNGNHNQWRKL